MIELPSSYKLCMPKAAGALITDGQHVLLTRRASHLHSNPNTWALPGGHIEPGESIEQAALREAHEELGHLPPGLVHTKTIVVTPDYAVVVLVVSSDAMVTYRPFLNNNLTREILETAGWDWMPLDELQVVGNSVRWRPKMHPGLGKVLRAARIR